MLSYTELDRRLADAAVLLLGNIRIPFQFPPRITSDGRKGDWRDGELPGAEPVAAFRKSGAREITLTWTYIVDGGSWTTLRIAQLVRATRGYFGRVRDAADYRNLLVRFQMWQFTGGEMMTCRIKGVDVKQSETIVTPLCGITSEAYAMRTDITVDLRIWTKSGRGTEIVQNLEGLAIEESPQWY
jgi:hypothetical protein